MFFTLCLEDVYYKPVIYVKKFNSLFFIMALACKIMHFFCSVHFLRLTAYKSVSVFTYKETFSFRFSLLNSAFELAIPS
jgi:hypothetical protein